MNVKRRKDRGDANAELLSTSPFDGDLDAELAAAPKARALPGPTLYLTAGILLVAGFVAGIQAHKWSAAETAEAPPAAGMRAGGAGGGPPGGFGSGFARPDAGGQDEGEATTGTVTKISGRTVWIRTGSGEVVKVTTSGATEITVNGKVGDLAKGATVTVRGTAEDDGSITAGTLQEGRR